MNVSDISKYEVIEEGVGAYKTKIYKVMRELSTSDNEEVAKKIFKPNKEGKISNYLIMLDEDYKIWHICEKFGYEYKNFEITIRMNGKDEISRYIIIYPHNKQIVEDLVFILNNQSAVYIDNEYADGFYIYPFGVSEGTFFSRRTQLTPISLFNRFVAFTYVDFINKNNYEYFIRETVSDNKFNMIHIL